MIQPRVLVVDDDRDYLEIAERAIRRESLDASVRFARTTREALDVMGLGDAGGAGPPSWLVATFVDIHMPGVDGFELLRCIRADLRLHRLPVIMISSSSRLDDMRRSYDLGANSYLVKRYDPTGPGHYLVDAIRYWIELNRVPHDPPGSRT